MIDAEFTAQIIDV